MSNNKYPTSIRVIHWVMALIIIGLVVTGLTKDYWPNDLKGEFYYWHKSFGVVALSLIILRVIFRLKNFRKIPALPNNINKLEVAAGKLGHYALYALMIFMAFSGYLMSMAGGHGIKAFGYEIPNPFDEKNKEIAGIAHEIHEYAGITIAVVISIHILAVVKHFYFDKVNLLKRIS